MLGRKMLYICVSLPQCDVRHLVLWHVYCCIFEAVYVYCSLCIMDGTHLQSVYLINDVFYYNECYIFN